MMLNDVDTPTAMTTVPVRVQRLWRRQGLAIALLAFASAPSLAATIVVTSSANTGAGSLRQAIANANAGDTITFNLPLPATIPVSPTLTIGKNLTLQGPGRDSLTLDGGNTSSILLVSSGVTASISGMTLANGSDSDANGPALDNAGTTTLSNCAIRNGIGTVFGGIFNNADLTVRDCVFSGNSARSTNGAKGGGIYNFIAGTVLVERSTFTQNDSRYEGGAIYNTGSFTISDSYLHSNIADEGGAIANHATLVIKRSTFRDNRANLRGGAVFHWEGPSATMEDSTLVGNQANAGGAVFATAPMTVAGSTVAGNVASNGGAAFFSFAAITISRSIVASNGCAGDAPTSAGDNLAWLANGCMPASQLLNDRVLDPLLQPVADNGGPTPTMMPGAGSPAIDEVRINTCSGVDQRGISRPQGPRCDIGAVEAPDADVIFRSGFDQ